MNSQYVLLSQEILTLVAPVGGKKRITNTPGQKIDSLRSSAGYTQIIDKRNHIVNNSVSCIDLIFYTNKNINSNHGINVTIFEKCHHNIIYGKNNIRILLPPVYIRKVWDYSKTNIENINKVISNFNWTKAFENISVDEKVELLNEALLNIYRNYIPNKKIKGDYCQPQKYFTKTIKEKLTVKKYWKKLLNVLMKFLKLKRTIFLR